MCNFFPWGNKKENHMSLLTAARLARPTRKRQRINARYFLAHFCRWLLAQPFLDTAGSERVNEKLTQRFLGWLARVPAERRRTERFPEKLWKRRCHLPSYKWCASAALCGLMCGRGASLLLLNDAFLVCKSKKYLKQMYKVFSTRTLIDINDYKWKSSLQFQTAKVLIY